jgi:hypothetical protein
MFGLKTEERVKQEQVEVERIKTREERERAEREAKELAIKEFENLRSICLDCKHAFVERFIDNPEKPDPLEVTCRRKLEIWRGKLDDFYNSDFRPCHNNEWNRKTLTCSDFEKRV